MAFLDKNGIEHFDVFFGSSLLNAVAVDVNWRLAPPEVAFIVNDVEAVGGDVAFQLYSSGTTGRPKGVMLSNDNFFSLLPMAKEIWELSGDAVNLAAMPLFHIGGGGWATAGMYEGCPA